MRRLMSLVVALLLGSGAGIALTGAPAMAAACAKGVGVTVVVGGSVSCDGNGGDAANNFGDAGYDLTYVQRQPGFVCQVDGAPSSANCVNTPPADSYWALFWSDGTSGTWKYASQGVGSLSVPSGGWVAFVFQTSETKKYPSVKPLAASAAAAKPTPAPKPKPKPKPTSRPKATPTSKAAAPTASATTPAPTASTATPSPTASTKKPEPKTAPTAAASQDVPAAQEQAAQEQAELKKTSSDESGGSSGLVWVAGAIGALLVAGMGATVWRRKASGGQS